MPTGQSTYFDNPIYFNTANPFRAGGYIGQCTWYCWSKANAKAEAYPDRNLDTSYIPTSSAYKWYNEVSSSHKGSTPKNDCIAVWEGPTGEKNGHVAYVETWDGKTVCYSEANWNSSRNTSNTIQVPSSVYNTIRNNVQTLAPFVTVKSGGTDGKFKENTLSDFENRKPNFLGYIYLN